MKKVVVSLLIILCLVAFSEAHTPITTLPSVIITSGYYILDADLQTAMTSGNAIEIDADNVTIDLRGHTLSNVTGNTPTTAVGVWATGSFKNVSILNGTITGFWYAEVGLSDGLRIEGIRAAQNVYVGLYVAANGALVQNNQVIGTGIPGLLGADHDTYGIVVIGEGNRVVNNDVHVVLSTGSGHGRGIAAFSAINTMVVNNRVTGANHSGIEIGGADKYRDNIVSGVPIPYVGGTDIGNNH